MGSLTFVEKGADCQEIIDWPAFYMNDFSVLGLQVEGLARALEVLEADGYHVVRTSCSAKVNFANPHRFKKIFAILSHNRIEHNMSDLVGCVYQG